MSDRFAKRCIVLLLALVCTTIARAAVEPGQAAPDFTLTDLAGQRVTLSAYLGKTVVLEWTNPNCPFVRKHYVSGNMQALQRADAAKTVWLAINSTSPESSDHLSREALQTWVVGQQAAPAHYLLDPAGTVGRLYGAKTTPHMYVIDPQGRVAYAGAIDDRRGTSPEEVAGARNFVKAALGAVTRGEAVPQASTSPYGCSVKY
jgi:peroxiredoxin